MLIFKEIINYNKNQYRFLKIKSRIIYKWKKVILSSYIPIIRTTGRRENESY